LVIRRNTITKTFTAISAGAGSSNADNCDIYSNDISRVLANSFTADGFQAGSGSTNGAAWDNTLTDVLYGFSFSPYGGGPFWMVSNVCNGFATSMIRKGTQFAGDSSAYAKGWTVFVNNTSYTAYVDDAGAAGGIHCWATNFGQGNSRYANSIFVGTGRLYWTCPDGTITWPATNPDVLFDTCAFYTTDSDPEWRWDQTEYETEAAADAAVSNLRLQVAGNTYGTNPFPNGFPGRVNTALPRSTAFTGITNVLADPNGMPFGSQPIPLGAANGFIGTGELRFERRKVRSPNNRCPRLVKQLTGRVAIV